MLAVCIGGAVDSGHGPTGIDKRPVEGPVPAGPDGLAGDERCDRSHRGPDSAVYVFAAEDAEHWERELGRTLPPGALGENLRTLALPVSDAVVGEVWRIGDLLLEVRMPRTPCPTLSRHLGVEGVHRAFARSGLVGAKCRVVEAGMVRAGASVVRESAPAHGVSVGDVSRGLSAVQARALLDDGVALSASVRRRATRATRAARPRS